MQYRPFSQVEQERHVLVGGKPVSSTTLHLSNCPSNRTDEKLKAELCTQIAFNWLALNSNSDEEVVSAGYFGGDELAALFALVYPHEALSLKDELISLARAYSFEIAPNRSDAHRAFILRAWTDPELSPLNKGVFQNSEPVIANILFEELLPRLPKILEKVDYLERYWIDEENRLEATEHSFTKNEIAIEEIKALDLALVEVSESAGLTAQVLHSIAIHNRTDLSRILVLAKEGATFYYRVESGLDLRTGAIKPRVDLSELAGRLNEMEGGNHFWRFEPIASQKPRLAWWGDEPPKVEKGAFKNAIIEVLSKALS